MKIPRVFVMMVMALFGAGGCEMSKEYPKNIKEIPESWLKLEPGKPMDNSPRIEIVSQGEGALIEPGDLVQLHVRDWSPRRGEWREMDDWWLWVGFRPTKETAFYSYSPEITSALVGKPQGTSLKFLEGVEEKKIVEGAVVKERTGQLKLKRNPFGDPDYYSWRKNTSDSMTLSVPSASGYFSLVEIKRVCKGQAKYRTVRLFDDSPVQICSGLNCRVTTEPREGWVDEAKIDAVCQDGKKVNFQYGPIDSRNGKAGRSPKRGYFDDWFYAAWRKIPEGVEFEGNHAPETKKTRVSTKAGMPVRIDFLVNARDADGDKLSMRIVSPPQHGKLDANPDGSMTYTPEAGWFGLELVSYRVSDGMAEKGGQVEIEVVRPAW